MLADGGVQAVVFPKGSGVTGAGGGGGNGAGVAGDGGSTAFGGVVPALAKGTVNGPWHRVHCVVCPANDSLISITLAQWGHTSFITVSL